MTSKRSVLKKFVAVTLSIIVATGFSAGMQTDSAFAATNKMKVTWFNVGAGDSMLIQLPNGKTALIDGGTTAKGRAVVNKIKNKKISTINYLISTHPDADHVGGLQQVFKQLKVKNFYYPNDVKYDTQTAEKVLDLAESESNCSIHKISGGGKKIEGGNGSYIKFVHSKKDFASDNEDSIATFINYGKLQVLTCGDNEKGSEELIEKHNVDILQLPHHGSKYATSAKFIKRFDPEKIVISTDGKKYGHPNKEVFTRCKNYDRNIRVYRTDKHGDITVTATATSWSMSSKGASLSKYTSTSSGGTQKPTLQPSGGTSTAINVYITKTGACYHVRSSCSGLARANSITKVTKSNATSKGLRPCKICC